jgi:hypothetical protein
MTVRGTGWAMASMYSMSRRASTQPPASHTLGLLPPMVVSTVAVTPQAVPKDSRSVLSSAGGANKEIKLVQIDIRSVANGSDLQYWYWNSATDMELPGAKEVM